METLKGSWSGRLVDVGGFEGSVTLSLRESRGAVEGVFDASIEGHHRPTRLRGMVSGHLKGNQLALMLDLGQEDAPVSVSFEGDVFDTRSGGVGACGRYVVSARRSSPLLGGVMSVRQARPSQQESALLTRATVAPVLGAEPPPPPRRRHPRRKK